MKTEAALDEIIETHSVSLGSVKLSEQEGVDWRCEVVAEGSEGGLQLLSVDTAGLVPDGRKVWSRLVRIFHINSYLSNDLKQFCQSMTYLHRDPNSLYEISPVLSWSNMSRGMMVVIAGVVLLNYLTDHHVDGLDVELRVVAVDESSLELLRGDGAGLVRVNPVEVSLQLCLGRHVGRRRGWSSWLVSRHGEILMVD